MRGFSFLETHAHSGDVTGDGLVNVEDVLMVITAWGQCDANEPCNADIMPDPIDGQVGVDDLLAVLADLGG